MSSFTTVVIEDVLHSNPSNVTLANVNADSIAYVIFTSGSTGKPKGVTITHRSVMNTIDAVNKRFKIDHKDKVFALSELSFDLSVYDIYGMLSAGGGIVFPEQDKTKEPKHWLALLREHKVTIWNTVPQLADLLMNETQDTLLTLRLMLISGDHVPAKLPKSFKAMNPNASIITLGGATEGSIWSIWYDVTDGKYDAIPYGVAMPNQKMYVLNKNLTDCPIGVIGDIYIGGVGLAANYWKREDLTETSFIENDLYGRLYRTGDLGRWHESGYMEFMGRSDLQVKVNGHRVELEEIEAKLNALDGVEQTVVRVQEKDSKNYLVGYVVPSNQSIANLAHSDFDSQSFKLEQHGLIKDSKIDYQLTPLLNEKSYRLRKSYRKFNSKGVDIDLVTQTIKKLINKLKDKSINIQQKQPVTQESLTNLLGVISGLQLSGRVLPKYRYPSAGSSYSVRCFINIPKKVGSIKAGYYYYHPTQHGLYKMATEKDEELSLYLKAEWDAIKPLYGDSSEQFALQEAGHMLSLLLAEMEAQGLGYKVACLKGPIVKIRIGGNKQFVGNPGDIPQITYLKREGFSYLNKSHSCEIEQEDILTQKQEMNQILLNGSYLLVQEVAKYTEISMLLSGLLYQRISEALYGYDIGSCILGLTPFNGAIYTIVLGGIDDQDKSYSESMIDIPSFTDILNEHLKITLPEYMLPGNYMLLRELPLTASGKIDTKQLPHLEFVGDTYIAPTTELEKQLCDIWQELLNAESVGIVDNFFKLGGDSISAIKLVSRLKDLGYTVTVKDIFENSSIDKLCIKLVKTENELEIDHNFVTVANYTKPIEQLEKAYGKIEGIYPANSLQQGFISHFLTYPDDDAYIVQVLFDYDVILDVEKYKQAWVKITETYPILRTCFNWEKELIQVVYKKSNLDCNYLDLTDVKDKANKITKIQQKYRKEGFDLSKPSLLSLAIIKQNESHFTVLFNHHHAIMDGFSIPYLWRRLVNIINS